MNAVDLIDALDAALAHAETRRLRGRDIALTLVSPSRDVLGHRGRLMGPADDGRNVYGFTVKQTRSMRAEIGAAIREDLRGPR